MANWLWDCYCFQVCLHCVLSWSSNGILLWVGITTTWRSVWKNCSIREAENPVSRILQKLNTVTFCNMIYTTEPYLILFQGGRHLGCEASFTQDARQRSFKSKGSYLFGDKLKFRETGKMVTQIGGYFHNYWKVCCYVRATAVRKKMKGLEAQNL